MCTGWTWEYIDEHMTLPRLAEMSAYWKNNPPLHSMIAAYFGIGTPKKQSDGGDIAELMAAFPERPNPLTGAPCPKTTQN